MGSNPFEQQIHIRIEGVRGSNPLSSTPRFSYLARSDALSDGLARDLRAGLSGWLGGIWEIIFSLHQQMATSKTPTAASTGGCLTRSCSVFINELEQPARTYLYGRRMYEAMLYWETAHTTVQPRLFQEFTGIWQATEKIVFSKTLASVSSARTRVEPAFEPGLVRQLKAAAEHDMRVGGAGLAGQAIKAGLADEVRLFLVPVVVGGGKRALPDGVRSDLELLDMQRFASGAVYLRYCLQSA